MEYTTAQPIMTMPVTTAGYHDYNNQNNWMNNPFAYFIWMFAFRYLGMGNGWGNGGFGGEGVASNRGFQADRADQVLNASQIDAIRSQVAQIQADVSCGNANGMRFLDQLQQEARANGVAIQGVTGAICDAKTAVLSTLSDLQWRISNDTASVIAAINQCCCNTQNSIDTLACGIEKQILQQTNQIQGQLAANQFNTQAGFNSVTNGISQLGFALQQNDCNLRQLIAAEGCATRQLMRDLHTEDIIATKDATISSLQGKILEYSQAAQTATIINALKPATATTPAA